MSPPRPPSWRCARTDCPQHKRQPIRGRGDPIAAGTRELMQRWETAHQEEGDDVGEVSGGG